MVNRMIRITGMRMAQTRGRKSECRTWSSSTKGCEHVSGGRGVCMCEQLHSRCREPCTHHEQSPDGVVDEDGSGCDEHAESHEAVELQLSVVGRQSATDDCTAYHVEVGGVRSVETSVCSVFNVDVVRAPTLAWGSRAGVNAKTLVPAAALDRAKVSRDCS